MKIKEFPIEWARNVDLLTPLSLQTPLNGKQEVFYLKGRASEQISRLDVLGKEPVEKEGVKIYPYDTTSRSYPIEFGTPNPEASEDRRSIKEIWDILDGFAIPDCVVQERACIHQPPKKVPDTIEDVLQGVDELYQLEQSFGARRRLAGLPCATPTRLLKAELVERGIVKPNHPAFKRTRGVLVTAFVLPATKVGKVINLKGWGSFRSNENCHALQKVLRAPKFWQDTALPVRIIADRNGKLKGVVWRLETRDKLLGVEISRG
jgi:hypothetical protein